MKLALVIGTRPQIVKASAIVPELKRQNVDFQFINTGQHYDYEMNKIFFDEFGMRDSINLSVGSGSYCQQIVNIMLKLEQVFSKQKFDLTMCLGDTNSTIAETLVSFACSIPLVHVEAGARSYDMTMPEEVNRRLTDHASALLFAVSKNCAKNLLKENIPEEQIFLSGDPMYDVLLKHLKAIEKCGILEDLRLVERKYGVLTIHRPSNLTFEKFDSLFEAIKKSRTKVVFPIHPRTKKALETFHLKVPRNLLITNPLGYYEMMKLVSKAQFVMTDSGGLQKEAFWLRIPCLTLRQNTEWVETVRLGANELVENFNMLPEKIKECSSRDVKYKINPFGDGHAGKKIAEVVKSYA